MFKSFAKTKPPKVNKNGSATPTTAATSVDASPVDETMQGMSEEESEDIDETIAEAEAKECVEKAEASRKVRREREEKLRRMMEDDDEDEPMVDVVADEEVVDEESALDRIAAPVEERKEEATVLGGRRRGRRRVMKKKTFKDEDGYLGKLTSAVVDSASANNM